jgi:hypothetical protein
MENVKFGATISKESVSIISEAEQKMQSLTENFSDPELREFIKGLPEVTKDEIRNSYWENFKDKKTTRIQNMLALIEAVYDK